MKSTSEEKVRARAAHISKLIDASEQGNPELPYSPTLERFHVEKVLKVEDPDGGTQDVEYEDLEEEKKGLFQKLQKMVGIDITSITIPVSYSEPITFLQRLAENLQYHYLLDKAAQEKDADRRLLLVTAFALSPYSSGVRVRKPFNPVLGETFSLEREGLRLVCEQVSHHPPIGACHAENENFRFESYMKVKTKFGGNSLEVQPLAWYKVTLKATGEVFSFNQATSSAHNIIVGRMWIDHYGSIRVTNETTGAQADFVMSACGYFGRNFHEVKGALFDPSGVAKYVLAGKWNENIKAMPVPAKQAKFFRPFSKPPTNQEEAAHEEPFSDKELRNQSKLHSECASKGEVLWEPEEIKTGKGVNKWEFTRFGYELIVMDEALANSLPSTDSRLRPDRMALERGDLKQASKFKSKIEQRQRKERKARAAAGGEWVPRYFTKAEDESDLCQWVYKGNYWLE